MSLIKCPECGNEISSLARSCPNCGCPIDADETNGSQSEKCCPECGQSVNALDKSCPNCGYPINENESSDVLEKEVGKPSKTKIKRKDWIYCGVMVFVALLVVGVCLPLQEGRNKRITQHKIAALNQKQEEDKARFEAEEKIRKEAEEKARKEEEERNRPKEKEIFVRIIKYHDDSINGSLEVLNIEGCGGSIVQNGVEVYFTTDWIFVPKGKMWISKSINTEHLWSVYGDDREIRFAKNSYFHGRGGHGAIYQCDGHSPQKYKGETITVRGGHCIKFIFEQFSFDQVGEFRAVFTEVNDY